MRFYKKMHVIEQGINPDGSIAHEKHFQSHRFYLGNEKLPVLMFNLRKKEWDKKS